LTQFDGAHAQTRRASPTAVELFAGVGGFHLALHAAGFDVIASNQWEPSTKAQHAVTCLVDNVEKGRLPPHEILPYDIEQVLDEVHERRRYLPRFDVLVGGFPCQDYSVAKTLNQAAGIIGKKGVLWWQIHRLLQLRQPPFLFLENVDRLLKSPATHRGRDFAIMLASLSDLGYSVEWRVVNAAEYGFPQKRRRTFIVGRLDAFDSDPLSVLTRTGVLARALPVQPLTPSLDLEPDRVLTGTLAQLTDTFGDAKTRPFLNGGVMIKRQVWTRSLRPASGRDPQVLLDILQDESEVPETYFIPDSQLKQWAYLKGRKAEPRVHKGSGTEYFYAEGAIPFPDPTDQPSRTILTAEGGTTPSRFKHVVETPSGRLRRLTPTELERLNGFPDGWTDTGMPEGRRAFMMGNALVVPLVQMVAEKLFDDVTLASAVIEEHTSAVRDEVAAIA
jgi:DNA (cytosine-5)-methyltransferase 1